MGREVSAWVLKALTREALELLIRILYARRCGDLLSPEEINQLCLVWPVGQVGSWLVPASGISSNGEEYHLCALERYQAG